MEFKEDYLVHLCHCHGSLEDSVVSQVFIQFPSTNTYKLKDRRMPGTMRVFETQKVIQLYTQLYSGKALTKRVQKANREWFKKALLCLVKKRRKLYDLEWYVKNTKGFLSKPKSLFFLLPEYWSKEERSWYVKYLKQFCQEEKIKLRIK